MRDDAMANRVEKLKKKREQLNAQIKKIGAAQKIKERK